ncbi:MAG: hypothetical protein IJ620_02515 [Bacteroidales bacterium]|nr:hypothetical protein [Bacteroidales bacterium]
MKYRFLAFLCMASLLWSACRQGGTAGTTDSISQTEMQQVYEAVKTPYKYGLVVAPSDATHMMDSPTVFRHNNRWYMSYIVFDGQGYTTFLAESDDLLHWQTSGQLLGYDSVGWDSQQRAGYAALVDIEWGGSYEMEQYDGRYWMTYLGGNQPGYETKPLSIGVATAADPSVARLWTPEAAPVLSPADSNAQWFERETQYKSAVFRDRERRFGHDFVMFYNAYGVNDSTGLGAERIGIAFSDDMRHWQRYEGNPVVAHEEQGTISGDAHIQRIGDLYVMFYFRAFSPSRPYKAFNTFACSRDLVHWYDWQGDDLVFPSEPYDERYAHKSYLVSHDGTTYHYYCAVNNRGQRGIAVATSRDLGKSDLSFPPVE